MIPNKVGVWCWYDCNLTPIYVHIVKKPTSHFIATGYRFKNNEVETLAVASGPNYYFIREFTNEEKIKIAEYEIKNVATNK